MDKAVLDEVIPAIRRFAYSLTGMMVDADDLMQSTILKILNNQAPEDVDLLKWSFRVCRNLWIDEYRSKKVRAAATEDPELKAEQQVDGDRIVYHQLRLKEVNQAMENLPEQQRAVISMVAIEGMSYKEVASALELPLGTVMSRVARARTALSQLLGSDLQGGAI